MATPPVTVTFTSNNTALNAGITAAEARLNALNGSVQQLAQTMVTRGQTGNTALTQGMVAMQQQASQLIGVLEAAGAQVSAAGSHAAGAAPSLTFMTRELRALADEASAGRWRNFDGTLVNIIGHSTGLATAFAAANPALASLAAGAVVAAAALAFIAYEAFESDKAVKGIQLDAAVNQFDLTAAGATRLRDQIELLANVGASDAEAIARPFLALGPVGEIIAPLVSQHLPLLAQQMGKTLPEAAASVVKRFDDLSTAGRKYIEDSRVLTEAEKAQGLAFIDAGNKAGAWGVILTEMARSLATVEAAQRTHKEATDRVTEALAAGINAADGFIGAEAYMAAGLATTTARMQEQDETAARLRLSLAMASDAAGHLSVALTDAMKVDKIGADIKTTQGKFDEFTKALSETKDPEAISQLNRSLTITGDKLKQLRDEAVGGVLGGDSLSRINAQNRTIDQQKQGPRSEQLGKELPGLQAAASDDTLPEKTRAEAQQQADAMSLQKRDAQFEEENAQDEKRVLAANRNSAEIIKIREVEVARAIAVYKEGSTQAIKAEDDLARAKEQAANRGAAAGAKAAKDELAAAREAIGEEIVLYEKAAGEKIKGYDDDLAHKRIGDAAFLASTRDALEDEIEDVRAAYNQELAIAKLTAAERAKIEREMATTITAIEDQIVDQQRKGADKSQQAWDSATKEINSAFDSQVDGLLRGTTSWSQSVKNVLASLTEDVIKFFISWALQAAENEVKQIALNNTVVAAHVAGAATMAAADSTNSLSGIASMVTGALKAITADAGQTAAGVSAFMAPVVGPAAPAVGAAAGAEVMGFGALGGLYDTGSWSVPRDMVAGLHAGEVVIPQRGGLASQFRDIASGGGFSGGGGVTVNYAPVVSAVDSAGIQTVLINHGRMITKSIADMMDRNPSLRPTY